jgi:hypothetical protein
MRTITRKSTKVFSSMTSSELSELEQVSAPEAELELELEAVDVDGRAVSVEP